VRALLVVACSLASSCGCSSAAPGSATPVDARAGGDPDAAEPDAVPPRPRVHLGQPESAVNVALARTPAERARGLMYVQNLPVDDGMLFIFESDEIQSFWMRNTLIPLDMIFIRSDLVVVGVVHNATPMTDTPRGVDKPSRYVLEVNGGWAAAHGVGEGSTVRFEGFTP
jgi:uncharacterized membrane protein (UPF0127 family)